MAEMKFIHGEDGKVVVSEARGDTRITLFVKKAINHYQEKLKRESGPVDVGALPRPHDVFGEFIDSGTRHRRVRARCAAALRAERKNTSIEFSIDDVDDKPAFEALIVELKELRYYVQRVGGARDMVSTIRISDGRS